MSNTSSEQPLNRLEKERARKRAKRACESVEKKTGERMPIGKVINDIGHLNQKLNVHSVLLLVSSGRLIVELQNLKPNVHSVLLLVSSGRLIVELQNLKPSVHSVLLLVSSGRLIIELQNLKPSVHSVLLLVG